MGEVKKDYTYLDFDFFGKDNEDHWCTSDLYSVVCDAVDEGTTEDEDGNEIRPETVWVYGCNTEDVFMSEFLDIEHLLYIIKDEHDEEFGYDVDPDLPFLSKVSEEQKAELKKELGAVLNSWAKKHDLEPPFTRVVEGAEVEVPVQEFLSDMQPEDVG